MLISSNEVLNAMMYGAQGATNQYRSSTDFYDVLGRGEKLVVQVIADSGNGGTSNVTVNLEGSNDGMVWYALQTSALKPFSVALALSPTTVFPATIAADTLSQGVALPSKVRVLATLDAGNVATRVVVAVRGEMSR